MMAGTVIPRVGKIGKDSGNLTEEAFLEHHPGEPAERRDERTAGGYKGVKATRRAMGTDLLGI